MSHVFAPSQRKILNEFVRANVLLAFDFDGTLAPIVNHPRDAAVPQETRALLRRVSRLYPCAVISGRNRADVRRRLMGTGIRHIAGNHGADLAPPPRGLRRRVAHWSNALTKNLAGLEGVWVENKGLSLAVHYRNSPQRPTARQRVWSAAKGVEGARITPAKEAVNVTSAAVPDKGAAVAIQMHQLGCDRVIFVGDDHTDEDVFARDWGGALLGVSVGRRKSAASFQLRDQHEIDDFLRVLEGLRLPPGREVGT